MPSTNDYNDFGLENFDPSSPMYGMGNTKTKI